MESTIRIERYADQGRCVGHIDGRVVFVRFALPGGMSVRIASGQAKWWKYSKRAKTVLIQYGRWLDPLPWAVVSAALTWCMCRLQGN